MDEFQVKGGVDIHLRNLFLWQQVWQAEARMRQLRWWGINRLFKLGLSQKELMDRAVNIGEMFRTV